LVLALSMLAIHSALSGSTGNCEMFVFHTLSAGNIAQWGDARQRGAGRRRERCGDERHPAAEHRCGDQDGQERSRCGRDGSL
jgi:hypothetical protein